MQEMEGPGIRNHVCYTLGGRVIVMRWLAWQVRFCKRVIILLLSRILYLADCSLVDSPLSVQVLCCMYIMVIEVNDIHLIDTRALLRFSGQVYVKPGNKNQN